MDGRAPLGDAPIVARSGGPAAGQQLECAPGPVFPAVCVSHPCLTCGACCAFFRVSFHWSEADPALGGQVPFELTESLADITRAQKLIGYEPIVHLPEGLQRTVAWYKDNLDRL